jgi:putative FmdB family regulatory protein
MPTYDYQCDACGHRFEKFQSITAAPIRKCPKCGKRSVRRLLGTGAGILFKGSGFYITDYRSEGYKSAAKAESGGGGGSGSTNNSSTSSSDSKPAPSPSSETKPAATPAKSESKPAKKPKS